MNLQDFMKNIDFTELDKETQEKKSYVVEQREKLQKQIDEKISNIILVKKRKLQQSAYIEAAQKLKMFLTSAKNLVEIYFNLLDDEEKILLYNFSDLQDIVSKFRFCLFRSVHNMNRMLIKETQTIPNQTKSSSPSQVPDDNKKQANLKKKKRKKGKNSKMSIEQTGCMYKWILQNFQNPYPSQQEKQKLSSESKISISKVNYWFINMRQRTLKKLMSGENSGIIKKKKNEKGEQQKSQDFSDEQQSEMIDESKSQSQN